MQGLVSPRLRQDVAYTPQVVSWLHRPISGHGTGSSLLAPQPHIGLLTCRFQICATQSVLGRAWQLRRLACLHPTCA